MIIYVFVMNITISGNNMMGAVVGKFSMELAIEKAKQFGIGFVTVKG